MKTEELSVSLSEDLAEFVRRQVADGALESPSEYFRQLLIAERLRQQPDALEAKLLEGLDSQAREMTDSDWEMLERRAARP